MPTFERRQLSFHERYSLVQDNLSQPSLITYLASFSAKSTRLPSTHALQASLKSFVEEHAVLKARVEAWDTTKPTVSPLALGTPKRACETVVEKECTVDYPVDVGDAGSCQGIDRLVNLLQTILKAEIKTARQSLNIETGDMFRVIRVTDRGGQEDEGVIVLVVHHIITDGMGGLEFFSQLLRRAISPQSFPTKDIERVSQLPPALEDTINLKPSALTIARTVWTELVIPKLPAFLSKRLMDPTSKMLWPEWPTLTISNEQDHSTLACNHSIVVLPAELTKRLYATMAAHVPPQGTPRIKLTSILVAALNKAIHSTVDPSVDVVLESCVPLSERDRAKGHPELLGNCMVPGTFRWGFGLGIDEKGKQESVWEIAEDLARRLEGDLRTNGRETLGMSAYIPDGVKDARGVETANFRRRGFFTGWEEFFGNAEKRAKYSSSLQFSNLGRIPLSFPQVDAVVWGHPAACLGAQAIEVDCIGMSRGDVWLCFNWREGKTIGSDKVRGIAEDFKGILERLAASQV